MSVSGFSASPTNSPVRLPSLGLPPPKLPTPSINPSIPMLTQRSDNIVIPSILPKSTVGGATLSPRIEPNTPVPSPSILSPPGPYPSIGAPVPSPSILSPPGPYSSVGTPFGQKPLVSSATLGSISPSVRNVSSPIAVNNKDIQFFRPDSVNQDIEKKLLDLGYMSIGTIKFKRDNEITAKYIKAIDNKGNMVLIALNIDSNIAVHPSDLTTVESVFAVSIPYSLRAAVFNAAGSQVSGVAFDCENGLCTMLTDPSNKKMKEVPYSIIERPSDKVALEANSVLGIPIVRMSDILENPTLTSKIISDATVKIRNEVLRSFTKDLESTDSSVKVTSDSTLGTLKSIQLAMNRLIIGLTRFEVERDKFDLNPAVDPVSKGKYDIIILNIKKRQNLLRKLLEIARSLESVRSTLNGVREYMGSIIKELDQNYIDVDKIIYT